MSMTPSAVAMRRLQSELQDWLRSPPEGCRLLQFDPLTTWVVEMLGPESSPCGSPLYRGAPASDTPPTPPHAAPRTPPRTPPDCTSAPQSRLALAASPRRAAP